MAAVAKAAAAVAAAPAKVAAAGQQAVRKASKLLPDKMKHLPIVTAGRAQSCSATTITYQPLPTEPPALNLDSDDEDHVHIHIDTATWGGRLISSVAFQNVMGMVIISNSAVLGMETDMGDWEWWDEIEQGFLVVFTIEVVLKLCIERHLFFHPMHEDFVWNIFDLLVVGLGIFDLVARKYFRTQGTGGFSTIFRTFRLLRILRIFRLLKFLKRLYLLAMGLIEAAKAIFWVTILMSFVLYVCALVLVKTVGRPPDEDPHHAFMDNHFGTIPESMITLFVLMSSPNLPIYQEEVGLLESKPYLTLFLIGFITFGSFGMIAMLTGVINESMFENNEMQKDEKRQQHDKMRECLGERCADLFSTFASDDDGEVSIELVKASSRKINKLVGSTGAHFSDADIITLIHHMDVDSSGTLTQAEFIHAVEKISEGHSPMAILEVHHAVGMCNHQLSILTEKSEKILKSFDNLGKCCDQPDMGSAASSRNVAEIGDSIQRLSDQIGSNEHRLQCEVSRQLSEMGSSVQRLLEQKFESSGMHLSLSTGQQIEEIQKSVQKLVIAQMDETQDPARDRILGSSIERIGVSVQQMRDQLSGSDTSLMSPKGEASRRLAEIQKSVERLVEKDNHDVRRQLAQAGQMTSIASNVQKVLQGKDGREPVKPGQTVGATEDIRTFLEKTLLESQQSHQVRINHLQRQVDAAQANLLGGVAELGGVLLDGVGELLSKRMTTMQASLLQELATAKMQDALPSPSEADVGGSVRALYV